MSGQTGAQYVMMETHYNNEGKRAGLIKCPYAKFPTQFVDTMFQTMWTVLVYESSILQLRGSTMEQFCNSDIELIQVILSSCHLEETTS